MTTNEEARAALRGWIDNPHRSKWVKAKTMGAADAYALTAHVDACERYEWNDEQAYNVKRGAAPKCGDGWLCPQAKEIKELR